MRPDGGRGGDLGRRPRASSATKKHPTIVDKLPT